MRRAALKPPVFRLGAVVVTPQGYRAEVMKHLPDDRLDLEYVSGPMRGQPVTLAARLVRPVTWGAI